MQISFVILFMVDLYKDNHVRACMPTCMCAFVNFFFKKTSQKQGVRSRRNVRESRRLWKNHVQIYVRICPRTYEKNLLNLLKSSIPDIFTSTLTIFSVETIETLCQSMS